MRFPYYWKFNKFYIHGNQTISWKYKPTKSSKLARPPLTLKNNHPYGITMYTINDSYGQPHHIIFAAPSFQILEYQLIE